MSVLLSFLTTLLFVCLSAAAQAEKLRIVTEPWAPYVYLEDGQPKGIDYEVTALVFKRLGIEVEWQFLPWRRCLAMLETGQADGVLDIFRTDQREEQLYYPSEPLSEVEFALFQSNRRPHRIDSIDDLRGLTVGTSAGYTYSQAFREATTFKREPAPTQEANFGKLERGRIDLLITDRRVGRLAIKSLGLEGQVSELPIVMSREKQYLAVRRNVGMDLLAQRFAAELKRFKREPAYATLNARYFGGDAGLPESQGPALAPQADKSGQTVEQRESSAR